MKMLINKLYIPEKTLLSWLYLVSGTMWGIWAKDTGFGLRRSKSDKFKTCYGVTSSQDYVVIDLNEEMSHHTTLRRKASHTLRRNIKIPKDGYPSKHYGITSSKDYVVTALNEEMSHHTTLRRKASNTLRRNVQLSKDGLSESALRRNVLEGLRRNIIFFLEKWMLTYQGYGVMFHNGYAIKYSKCINKALISSFIITHQHTSLHSAKGQTKPSRLEA